jgi:hypothetical protein
MPLGNDMLAGREVFPGMEESLIGYGANRLLRNGHILKHGSGHGRVQASACALSRFKSMDLSARHMIRDDEASEAKIRANIAGFGARAQDCGAQRGKRCLLLHTLLQIAES